MGQREKAGTPDSVSRAKRGKASKVLMLCCDKILPRPTWFALAVELGLCFRSEMIIGVNCFYKKIAINIAVTEVQSTVAAISLHTWKMRGTSVPRCASSLL